MQETHSVEAEMKIRIKSQSILCTGAVGARQAHWFLRNTEGWAQLSWVTGIWDAFKLRMQPLALGAGAPRPGWAAQRPCQASGCLGLYSQMAASLGIYSITTSPLPGGFHQLHNLSRQLDPVLESTFANCPSRGIWLRQECSMALGIWTQL